MFSKLKDTPIQHGSDGSISISDSVLVKVSGLDDDPEKDVLVSWSLKVVALFCVLYDFNCPMNLQAYFLKMIMNSICRMKSLVAIY